MTKIIIQSTEINRNVQGKLKALFDEPVRHFIVWNGVYNNYADTSQVRAFFNECRIKVESILKERKDDYDVTGAENGEDEFYIIASGGVFHTLVVADILRENGVDNYKYLVYEPKIENYVVLDRFKYLEA